MAMPDFTGVILAGGRSARMGTDKARIVFDGQTLLDHMCLLLLSLGASRVIILGRETVSGGLGIADPAPFEGPARAIASWLATEKAALNLLVVPIDMPALTIAPLKALMTHPGGGYFDDLYLPFFAPMASPALANQGARMKDMLSGLGLQALPVPEKWRLELRNVNTPEELAALKSALQSSKNG